MKVGLYDVDSTIPNLALMKVSAWHKKRGDTVEFYNPFITYDKVYVSKVFSFSILKFRPKNAIYGGSGYDLTTVLPKEIESIYPDYALYECNYAIGFITRGCSRKCSFCIVPEKEGKIKRVGDIASFWKEQKQIKLLDNNLTAHPDCIELLGDLKSTKAQIDFSQGLDLRLVTPSIARALAGIRLWKQIHFAWDNIKAERLVFRGLKLLEENGVKKYKIMIYILIGYDSTPEEDMYRVIKLRDYGVDPFVMPFNKKDGYQKRFARWVNHKAIFKTVVWENYGIK
jgi:hypothetical protein